MRQAASRAWRRAVGAWRGRADGATLLDAADAHAVVRLVRALDAGDGADELADRLTRLFDHLPPDERLMRRLSVLHQEREADGGLVGYCVATVYMAATEALMRRAPSATPARATRRSEPARATRSRRRRRRRSA